MKVTALKCGQEELGMELSVYSSMSMLGDNTNGQLQNPLFE